MDSQELLKLMDQVRAHTRVTNQGAKAALERNGYNVVDTILELERTPGRDAVAFSRRTLDEVLDPVVTFKRGGRSLVTVPAVALAGAALAGLKRPRLLLAAVGLLLASGTDLSLSTGGRERSLFETFRTRSSKAAANAHGLKDKLDDRFQDIKGYSLHRTERGPGLSYFTIKL